MTHDTDLSPWARRDLRADRLLRSAPSPVHHDETVELPQQDPWKAYAIVSSLALVVLIGFGSMLRTSDTQSPSELVVELAASVVTTPSATPPSADVALAKTSSKALAGLAR